jgi:hypothetical protein
MCIWMALLACCACSTSVPVASNAGPGTSAAAPAAKADDVDPAMGIEARAILGILPAGPTTPPPSLKSRYPDKAAFIADVKAIHPVYGVKLDGKVVWSGVAPVVAYRTSEDGSVSQ